MLRKSDYCLICTITFFLLSCKEIPYIILINLSKCFNSLIVGDQSDEMAYCLQSNESRTIISSVQSD